MGVVYNITWIFLASLSELLECEHELLCSHRDNFTSVLSKLEINDKEDIPKIQEAIKTFEFSGELTSIDKKLFYNSFLAVLLDKWDKLY